MRAEVLATLFAAALLVIVSTLTKAEAPRPADPRDAEIAQLRADLNEAAETLQATPQCRRFWRDGRGML